MTFIVLLNVAVHPAEGRREAPLPRIGWNGWLAAITLPHAGTPQRRAQHREPLLDCR